MRYGQARAYKKAALFSPDNINPGELYGSEPELAMPGLGWDDSLPSIIKEDMAIADGNMMGVALDIPIYRKDPRTSMALRCQEPSDGGGMEATNALDEAETASSLNGGDGKLDGGPMRAALPPKEAALSAPENAVSTKIRISATRAVRPLCFLIIRRTQRLQWR